MILPRRRVATFIGPSWGPVKRATIPAAVRQPAPAIGRCLAERIVKGKPETADLSRFRSTRFAGGALWVDRTGYGIERLTISR